MKQFFGAFFGSIIGLLVATLLAVFVIIAVVKSGIDSALKGGDRKVTVVSGNTVLRLRLEGELVERERENPFEQLGEITPFVDASSLGLNSLVEKITAAAHDDKVEGIYLHFNKLRAGVASLHELRGALEEFRKKGKFIYSYSEDYSQGQYYLASVADSVYLHPEGTLLWKGLSMNLLFFRKALEKLEIEMQIFRHGKFKSAIEPLILDKMSEANRLQSEVFLNSIWNSILEEISASRNIPVQQLNAMANQLSVRFPEDAVGTLVDRTAYEDEVLSALRRRTGKKDSEKISFVEMDRYFAKLPDHKAGGSRIAVVYANGPITSGKGRDDEAGSERLCKAIKEARTDDKVKAIVLRVNSPGGSALASDAIWREMFLAQKAKPTAVSMGDVAASGGYYISCAAGRIFAQPNTITGSIGVFGVVPNFRPVLEKKLGIMPDTVNTNKYSDFGSGLRSFTEKESEFLQASVERVYETFTRKVSEGRSISQSQVDSVGQGRVWSGTDALRLKLVDELGGLSDAVKYVASKAGLEEYRLIELPKLKGPFDGLLNNLEREVGTRAMPQGLGKLYPYVEHLRSLLELGGVQARLPFDILID